MLGIHGISPVIVTTWDNKGYTRFLFYSYYTTITGVGGPPNIWLTRVEVNGLTRLKFLLYGGESVECRSWIPQARNPKALNCSCKREEATLEGSEVYS